MGARHATQVLLGTAMGGAAGWFDLSEIGPAAFRVNRTDGYNVWEADVPDETPVRAYHRSNSGHVETTLGAYAGPGGTTVPLATQVQS
jgi:hypothetical protein